MFTETAAVPSYKGYRFPAEVISHAVCPHHRLPLSHCELEVLPFQRGITVSYATVRAWCTTSGTASDQGLHQRQPKPGDKWHLDEVFIKVNGKTCYPWRAVGQDSDLLDTLVQNRRDARATKRFFRSLLRGCAYVPREIVTDKLRSYSAAHRQVIPSAKHRGSKPLNSSRFPPAPI
ncbi:IS6 family transposase [Streptomyces sp. NPDC057743]|uniref:IS6 family transposase n=1 Tax=Streptomyces sp. NPDC057743 TaxID=3346236 RepID=UPI0036AD6431